MASQYVKPAVIDYGSLAELTAACVGDGNLDEAFKGDTDPFQFQSGAFGDEAFCVQ